LVKTVLIEAILPADDQAPDIQFRIEIFSWSEQEYSCQVWRLDTYRVQPTLQAEPSQLADEEWLVLDHGLDWRQLRAATVDLAAVHGASAGLAQAAYRAAQGAGRGAAGT